MKELQITQEKLRVIDKLSNCIQKLTDKESKEVAYLIHRIIEADYLDSELARHVQFWQIQANKDLFITI